MKRFLLLTFFILSFGLAGCRYDLPIDKDTKPDTPTFNYSFLDSTFSINKQELKDERVDMQPYQQDEYYYYNDECLYIINSYGVVYNSFDINSIIKVYISEDFDLYVLSEIDTNVNRITKISQSSGITTKIDFNSYVRMHFFTKGSFLFYEHKKFQFIDSNLEVKWSVVGYDIHVLDPINPNNIVIQLKTNSHIDQLDLNNKEISYIDQYLRVNSEGKTVLSEEIPINEILDHKEYCL